MGIIDSLTNINADAANVVFQIALSIFMYVLLGAGIIWGLVWLTRWLFEGRKNKVLVYEQKHGKTYFLGEDRVTQKRNGGIDFAVFRRFNKYDAFKNVKWPDSDILFHNGSGRNLIHCILNDGQIVWGNVQYQQGKELELNPMPIDQKMDYMQQQDALERMYGTGNWLKENWPLLALGGIMLANILIVFFQYQAVQSQQSAVTAQYSTLSGSWNALASAIQTLGVNGTTIPQAP